MNPAPSMHSTFLEIEVAWASKNNVMNRKEGAG